MPTILLYDGATAHDVTCESYTISSTRGRQLELSSIDPGICSVSLRNQDRDFDPDFGAGASGDFGQIKLGRKLVIEDDGVVVFTGAVEDFNYAWTPAGVADATIVASDSLAALASAQLQEWTPAVYDRPGERISAMLDRAEIAFPVGVGFRDISPGLNPLSGTLVEEGAAALGHAQTLAAADHARLFVNRLDVLTYRDRYSLRSVTPDVTFGPSDVCISTVNVRFGSELLHFKVTVDRVGGIPRTSTDQPAIDADPRHNARHLSVGPWVTDSDAYSEASAAFLVERYSAPVAVISEMSVVLDSIESPATRAAVAALDINGLVSLSWTPTDVGDPVEGDYVIEGVRYESNSSSERSVMTFHLSAAPDLSQYFVLDTDSLDGVKLLGF